MKIINSNETKKFIPTFKDDIFNTFINVPYYLRKTYIYSACVKNFESLNYGYFPILEVPKKYIKENEQFSVIKEDSYYTYLFLHTYILKDCENNKVEIHETVKMTDRIFYTNNISIFLNFYVPINIKYTIKINNTQFEFSRDFDSKILGKEIISNPIANLYVEDYKSFDKMQEDIISYIKNLDLNKQEKDLKKYKLILKKSIKSDTDEKIYITEDEELSIAIKKVEHAYTVGYGNDEFNINFYKIRSLIYRFSLYIWGEKVKVFRYEELSESLKERLKIKKVNIEEFLNN